jgi:hypothetical protein
MPRKACPVRDEHQLFVTRLLDGQKMAPPCEAFGISRKTDYRIFTRCKGFVSRG